MHFNIPAISIYGRGTHVLCEFLRYNRYYCIDRADLLRARRKLKIKRTTVIGVNTIFSKLLFESRLPIVLKAKSPTIKYSKILMIKLLILTLKMPAYIPTTASIIKFTIADTVSNTSICELSFNLSPQTILNGITPENINI